jgi:uncharacterized caspase-like protein
VPTNMLIAYAQKAGLTAEDGEWAHSPYTTALLKHLATPGLDVELARRAVRDEVLSGTHNTGILGWFGIHIRVRLDYLPRSRVETFVCAAASGRLNLTP